MPQTWFRNTNLSHIIVAGLGQDMPIKYDDQSPSATNTLTIPAAFPATAIKLEIIFFVKSTQAANIDTGLRGQFNGDSGANYNYVRNQLTNAYSSTNAQTGATFFELCLPPAANAPNTHVAAGVCEVMNPNATGNMRQVLTRAAQNDLTSLDSVQQAEGEWTNTAAAITTIRFFLAGGNFAVGSRFISYYWL